MTETRPANRPFGELSRFIAMPPSVRPAIPFGAPPAALDTFFRAATGHAPYDYQCRLACGERQPVETDNAWLAHGTPCASQLIDIPTGLGKTAQITL